MALRDQPYLPLYIQDFLTDEKLMECGASAHGVYIRLMCIMHKSEHYGKILLKQKYKQSVKQSLNFASQLAKSFPFPLAEIEAGISELLSEGVLQIEGDFLIQKRMVKDSNISEIRSSAGKKGGDNTQKKNKTFASNFAKPKSKANTEIEIEYENEVESVSETEKQKKPKVSKTEIEIIYPFDSKNFIEIWNAWKQYRKEIGKPIKSALSEQQALIDLQKYGEDIAIKMIRQSIANSWQGIFPLKTNQSNGKQTVSDQHAELDRIGNEARERLAKHFNGGIDLGK